MDGEEEPHEGLHGASLNELFIKSTYKSMSWDMEVAGIEPASANPPPSALHAYPCHWF